MLCLLHLSRDATLVLVVNGFLHRGPVFISYNSAEDLYEVRTMKNSKEVIKTETGVYADELGSVVDRLVEKDCSQEDYEKMVNQSLS